MPTNGLVVANETMDASSNEYVVPDGVSAVTFRARDGEIKLRHAASGDYFTISAGAAVGPFKGYTVPIGKYFFEGADGIILEILLWYGTTRT